MSLDPIPTTAPQIALPAKRPRGRPRIFDETRRAVLCSLISIGLSRKEACRKVGVHPSSVVHAARTDSAFAARLHEALIARANRPPELAHIGSRSWRPYARRLEALFPDFRPASFQNRRRRAERHLKRLIPRIVLQVLNSSHPISRRALAQWHLLWFAG